MCHLRFTQNVSWEEVRAYKAMQKLIKEKGVFDGCVSLDDIKQRYKEIDLLF
jgi:hypothetical protein